MARDRRMRLFGLKQATVGHTAVGLWRHPRSQAHLYKRLGYWVETARLLEEGKFDGLFIADALGVLDSWQGRIDATLRHGVQTPNIDPLLIVSGMAAATRRLGFAITVSTTYEQPYALARKMTTLDHLTEGRIGWNIVTSALETAARNLGLERQIPHDERYAIAEEFMTVAYKLWEGSWEDDAVRLDREGGWFADPARVHAAGHAGPHYRVPDAFLCEPSVQRTPVLFQAGTSTAGRAFAARHAEGIFLSVPRPEMALPLVRSIRALAAAAGRDPGSLRFIALAAVVADTTQAAAEARLADYQRYVSEEGHLARHSALFQIDLSRLDLDAPLDYVETDGIRSTLEVFTRGDPSRRWTPRQIGRSLGISGGGPTFVGTAAAVADALQDWMVRAEIDGFNIVDPLPHESYGSFVALVVPELQRRGLVWSDYEGASFRETMRAPGQPRLPEDHPGAAFRPAARQAGELLGARAG
jgi:FMN-dependent oxidoreductase (nitrilotriacetate monooxygenase family)